MADDPKPDPKPDPKDDLGDAGKRALEQERTARRDAEKKLRDLEAEVTRLKDSKQSDEEKVSTKLAELEKRANEAEARTLRAEVATAKGLTAAQAKRLQGATREDLEADADDLLESFPAPKADEGKGGDDRSRKPREALRGGGDPTETPVETDPAKLAAGVPRY